MKTYYQTAEGQQIFDRTVDGFSLFWGLFAKVFVYSPLLVSGYIISRFFLTKADKGYYWVGSIVLCAVAIYCLLILLKGVLLALKWRGSWGWIAIFGVCLLYTCIPPGIMVFDFLRSRVHNPVLHYGISLAIGYWVYTRYHFLIDLVPPRFWVFYAVGLRLGGFRHNNN